jgi:hypothetical protein
MEEERSSSLVGRISMWVGSCLLAVILYIASIGPVILLLPSRSGQYPILTAFYRPLKWIAENTPLEDPITAYIRWWVQLRGP